MASVMEIKPGDIYEDCSYHPVFCTSVDEDGDSLYGISLIDATTGRNCSLKHCGVRKLTLDEAKEIKENWPKHLEESQQADDALYNEQNPSTGES